MQNILLSSIFRKLPLKLLLVILAVFAVCMACFSHADDLVLEGDFTYFAISLNSPYTMNTTDGYVYCFLTSTWDATLSVSYNGNSYTMHQNLLCFNGGYPITLSYTQYTESYNIYVWYFNSNENNFKYSSLQCQTEYNLIPISSVDQNYCTSNNLCPAQYTESQCKSVYGLIDESECTGGSGSGLSLTELYINNILHVGAPTILMNIPEEIDWDYAYTNGGNVMNIDVVGYNQDTEYINGLIDINNYKPTSEDFTNVFSNFSNFGGLLVAALFVILVFYFVKKMFK